MKSIIQKNNECWVCKSTYGLHTHHVFGASNKKASDKYGLTIKLCLLHHTGSEGIHFDREFDFVTKQLAQEKFEEINYESFIKIFGRNYLGVTFTEYIRGR